MNRRRSGQPNPTGYRAPAPDSNWVAPSRAMSSHPGRYSRTSRRKARLWSSAAEGESCVEAAPGVEKVTRVRNRREGKGEV